MAFAAPLLPFLGTFLTAGSAALTGISAYGQSKYQANVAKNNAKIAEENAARAADATQKEQLRSDREFRVQLGEQLAIQSASGLDILGLSQMKTRANLRRVRGEAASDIRQKGATDVANLFQEAANYKSEASAAKQQGLNTLIGTAFNIGTIVAKNPTVAKSLAGGAKSTKKALV